MDRISRIGRIDRDGGIEGIPGQNRKRERLGSSNPKPKI
jgi:hypothetical protein